MCMNNCSWYSSSYTCSTSLLPYISHYLQWLQTLLTAPSCFACSHFPPSHALSVCVFSLICLSLILFLGIPFKAKTLSLSTRVSQSLPPLLYMYIEHAM
ncbi:hypothetical protein IWW34DRAFT_723066 [Fusarium oxysporum f. sp. albedinis]|nr:hypothetical protein IWW34DRAFT_723066 [Fusarium oxysporum f. sp. albedinis]